MCSNAELTTDEYKYASPENRFILRIHREMERDHVAAAFDINDDTKLNTCHDWYGLWLSTLHYLPFLLANSNAKLVYAFLCARHCLHEYNMRTYCVCIYVYGGSGVCVCIV